MKNSFRLCLIFVFCFFMISQITYTMANDELGNSLNDNHPIIKIVGTITTSSTKINGLYDEDGAKISLKAGSKILKTTTVINGKFTLPLAKQKPGTKLSIIASESGLLDSHTLNYTVKLENPTYEMINIKSDSVSGKSYNNTYVTAYSNGENIGSTKVVNGRYKIALKKKPVLGKLFSVRAVYGKYSAKTSVYATEGLAIVKDASGKMHRIVTKTDVLPMAKEVRKLFNFNKERGIKSIAVMVPPSINKENTKLPSGVTDYANALNSAFINQINAYGYKTLDLRKPFMENGLYNNDLYYKYDHHWKVESSFWASTYVTEELNQLYKLNLDPKKVYSNYENYNKVLYKKYFQGSFVKSKVETTGYEDFTKVYPKFDTSFTMTSYSDSKKVIGKAKGNFTSALLRTIKKGTGCYGSYMRGYSKQVEIVNNKADNNINAMVITTSIGRSFSAFLSSYFKKTTFVDLQSEAKFNRSVYDYIGEFKPKVVILLYTAPTFGKTRVWQFDMK